MKVFLQNKSSSSNRSTEQSAGVGEILKSFKPFSDLMAFHTEENQFFAQSLKDLILSVASVAGELN